MFFSRSHALQSNQPTNQPTNQAVVVICRSALQTPAKRQLECRTIVKQRICNEHSNESPSRFSNAGFSFLFRVEPLFSAAAMAEKEDEITFPPSSSTGSAALSDKKTKMDETVPLNEFSDRSCANIPSVGIVDQRLEERDKSWRRPRAANKWK